MTTTIGGTTGVVFPDGSAQTTAATNPGFKNRIINGAMMIDQRNAGAAVTVTTSGSQFYAVDRMAMSAAGASFTAQQTTGTGAYKYDVLLTGAASVTAAYFYQRIESKSCFDLTSQTVTFQVQLSSSSVTSVAVGLYAPSTTDVFPGSAVSTTTFTITSTPTIYTWTVNAGSNAANGLQIQLNFGAFTSGTVRVSGMQVEKGSTATSFDYRPYGTEFILCQRYYSVINTVYGTYYAAASMGMFYYPTTMRTTPTATADSNAGSFSLNPTGVQSGYTYQAGGSTAVVGGLRLTAEL